MDCRFKLLCELCDEAVTNASEFARGYYMKPMSAYYQIRLGEREERTDACSAAGHVRDELLAKLEREAVKV